MGYGTLKYIPSPVGDYMRIAFIKLFAKKFEAIWMRAGIHIWWPGNLSVGKSWLNEDMHINAKDGITIGDNVLIGHRCTFNTDEHNFEDPEKLIIDQGAQSAPIVIEDGAYIGVNVVVMPGVTIGRGAVIGACSVVTRSVPSMAVALGVPARVVRYRGSKLKVKNVEKTG